MSFTTALLQAWQFITEAFIEIFSNTDDYPETGLQPFEGDPWSEWS